MKKKIIVRDSYDEMFNYFKNKNLSANQLAKWMNKEIDFFYASKHDEIFTKWEKLKYQISHNEPIHIRDNQKNANELYKGIFNINTKKNDGNTPAVNRNEEITGFKKGNINDINNSDTACNYVVAHIWGCTKILSCLMRPGI